MSGIFEILDGTPAQRRGQVIARALYVLAAAVLLVNLYLTFVVHDTRRPAVLLGAAAGVLIVAAAVLKMRSTPKQVR